MQRTALLIIVAALVFSAALLAPLIAYVLVFGLTPLAHHQRWAELGSFVGGIYTPLLALCTLAVLVMQVLIQRHQAQHQFDQSFLQQSRSDLEFYMLRLLEALQTPVGYGNNVREVLHSQYQPDTLEALRTPEMKKLGLELHTVAPEIIGFWSAIQPILQGLEAPGHQPYKLAHTAAISKLAATLSMQSCIALDNYLLAHAENHEPMQQLKFSSLAAQR